LFFSRWEFSLLCSVELNKLVNERPSLVNENGMMEWKSRLDKILEKKQKLLDHVSFFS
jgi:hypothetical protein